IFPGAKVFQLPPPAVEASAVDESGAALGAGAGDLLGEAAGSIAGGGELAASAGRVGVAALATWIGLAVGEAGFCAITGACDGAAVGAGVALPFASLPRFPGGVAATFAGGGEFCAT